MDVTLKNRLDTIVSMAMAIIEDELRRDELKREGKFAGTDEKQPEGVCRDVSTFFTNKELSAMPKLKDGKFRRRGDGLYEVRYRKDGYDKSFTSAIQAEAIKKYRAFIFSLKAAECGAKQTVASPPPPKRTPGRTYMRVTCTRARARTCANLSFGRTDGRFGENKGQDFLRSSQA